MKKTILIFSLLTLLLPAAAAAQDNNCGLGSGNANTTVLANPLSFINVCTPGELVAAVVRGFAAIAAVTAVAFVVFAGFKLIIAGFNGDEESITSARAAFTWSLGGFIITLLSFVIISGTAKILGYRQELVPVNSNELISPIQDFSGNNITSFWVLLNFIMVNFLDLIGVVTILAMIYYGYRYIAAAGEEESILKAKTGLKWAITGFAIAILAFVIIYSVQKLFLRF